MSDFHFSPRPNRANEIRWHEWGDAPFDQARAQNKPVLLAISAVWCHWCHVMDETTYSSSDVIEAINNRYVPVRVDNDRRPDVNARYNQGGWPTTAILTPDGELLKGATYVPPEQMHQLLRQIDTFYSQPENRVAVLERVNDMKSRRIAASRPDGAAAALKPDVPDRIFSFLDAAFDERYGGFGADQKFPQTGVLHFLLDRWARTGDVRSQELAQRTLHAMAGGGMYDRVAGGFYRYSTTRDYSVPHFEKMLEDLGGLLLACARAGAMFDDAELQRVAVDVRAYLDAHLWNDAFGAYGGSQDADEAYYSLDKTGRAALPEPYVDPTIYTSWNAQTAGALIVAGPLLRSVDAAEWTQRGILILENLWAKLLTDGVMSRYHDGSPHVRGLLADQAWSAWAALGAFEGTGDAKWLNRAERLVEAIDALFVSDDNAYADRLAEPDASGRLAETSFPLDDNALMARVLFKLASFTGKQSYRRRAGAVLSAFAESYRAYGMFAAAYGSAVLDWFAPPLHVAVVGASMDPNVDGQRLNALGRPAADRPVAYVCGERECFARATNPRELEASLSQSPIRSRT